MADWALCDDEVCAIDVTPWLFACEVDSGVVEVNGVGLLFSWVLVVSTMTAVDDAGPGESIEDSVGLAGGGAEVAAAGEVDGAVVADAPVPTGTFCRY